jgi:hypothetical protein
MTDTEAPGWRASLDARVRLLLPPEYQATYDNVRPTSMGSAGLRFDADGRVAWNDIWATFCDLAMAGGPPHKGTLLEPAQPAAIDAARGQYDLVVREICRGIGMVTGLTAEEGEPGWIRLRCHDTTMAGWLLRAIVMENVSARADGVTLELPAGPTYRLEKEIKNVITVIAKTCHYWVGHVPRSQQLAIGELFDVMAGEWPLIVACQSPSGWADAPSDAAGVRIQAATGLRAAGPHYRGWCGLDAGSVRRAIWLMRALLVGNVLARREGTVLFLPLNPVVDPEGQRTAAVVSGALSLAEARSVTCEGRQPSSGRRDDANLGVAARG